MKCRLILGLLGALLAGHSTLAFAQILPYQHFPCQEYPTRSTRQLSLQDGPFPDADPQALEFASYSQLSAFTGEVGVVALRSNVHAYATVIHYSLDGVAYVPHQGISLPLDHQLSLSFRLPPRTARGVTRVVLWQEEPDPGWIQMLALHPNFLAEQVPDLLSQRWFESGKAGYDQAPWEDPLRQSNRIPFGFSTQWPFAQAELSVNELVHAKDSVITYTGATATASDVYGVYGRWYFYWGSELRLEFTLPPERWYGRAQLHLIGEAPGSFGIGGSSLLEVRANGWTVLDSAYGLPLEDGRELFVYPLSQYLERGTNEIVLALDSFSGAEWMLDRIELWIE